MVSRIILFFLFYAHCTSCSLNFSSPLVGPLLLDAQIRPNVSDKVYVAISHASLKRHMRSNFLQNSDELYSSLTSVDGYVGGSLRLEPFGDQVWALSLWVDKKSMDEFIKDHPQAIAAFTSEESIVDFRTSFFNMNSDEIPNVWQHAMLELDSVPMKLISKQN